MKFPPQPKPSTQATHGVEASDKLFQDIEDCVVKSLRAVCNIMINDKWVPDTDVYVQLIWA
jgi:hypothetical protein